MTYIICLTNQKGGIGKTTATYSLGAGFAKYKKKVLYIDQDPQANLSSTILTPQQRATIQGDACDWMLKTTTFDDIVLNCGWCDLVPGTGAMKQKQLEIYRQNNPLNALRNAMKRDKVAERYDVILIDCPPALEILTKTALTASTHFIVPFLCDNYSYEGYGAIIAEVNDIREENNPDLSQLGILINQYHEKQRDSIVQGYASKITKKYPDLVLNTYIRKDTKLKHLPINHQTIFEYAPESNAAADFDALTQELLKKLEPIQVS